MAAYLVMPLTAQYTSLSTDYSGSTLYFTTELSQAGSDQPDHGKVFIADADGIRPLLIREREVTSVRTVSGGLAPLTNYFHLVGVDIASRGSRIAVVGFRECGASSIQCGYADRADLYNDRGELTLSTDEFVTLSPNGRWALATAVGLTSPVTRLSLFNLDSGARYDPQRPNILGSRSWRMHDVADNGTMVAALGRELLVFQPPSFSRQVSSLNGSIDAAVIDAQGQMIVWEETTGGARSVRSLGVLHLSSGGASQSLRVPDRSDYSPKISDDGAVILFLSTPADADDPQVFTVRPDGTGRRQVTAEIEGISAAVLSGGGEWAWAVTRTGRLLRFSVVSGVQEQHVGPVAAFLYPPHCLGSAQPSVLAGIAGQIVSARASVMPWETVEIHIGTHTAPIVEVGVQRLSFQVPSDLLPNTRYELSISKPGDPGWKTNSKVAFSFSGEPFPASSSTCTHGELF